MFDFPRRAAAIVAAVLLIACAPVETGLFQAGADVKEAASGVVRQRLTSLEGTYFKKHITERPDRRPGQAFFVRINLFNDFAVDLELVERAAHDSPASVIFGGRAPDYEHSLVTLILKEGRLSGNIRLDGRLFRIRPAGDGLHRIEEVIPAERREHQD
jgi:hypothetical protein